MNKSTELKRQILARFPKGYKIKKDRVTQGARSFTTAALVSDSGTVIAKRDGKDYVGALANLEFQTSPKQSPRLRLAFGFFTPEYADELAKHDKEVGWATVE